MGADFTEAVLAASDSRRLVFVRGIGLILILLKNP